MRLKKLVLKSFQRLGIKKLLRGSKKLKIIYGFDTETLIAPPQTMQIFNPNICDHFEIVTEKSILSNFIAFLDDRCVSDYQSVFYCINLHFDMASLFYGHLEQLQSEVFDFEFEGWKISGVYSAVCFCSFKKERYSAMLLNASSFFAGSAEKLAKIHCPGLNKLEHPRDLGKIHYNDYTDDERIHFRKYAMRDAEIAYYVGLSIEKLHLKYEIPQCVSVPQMSGRIFRKDYIDIDHEIVSPAKGYVYNAHHSYRGGKNGLYCKPGLYKNVVGLDIISAYTYAMSKLPSFSVTKNYKPIWGKREIYPEHGIYQVSGTVKQCKYPILLQKDNRDVYQPVFGEIENIWIPGPELNEGIKSGEIDIKLCYGFYYKQDGIPSPFAKFAMDFYKLKDKAENKIERDFYKLMTNALYGKLCETRKKVIEFSMKKNEIIGGDEFEPGPLFFPIAGSLISSYTRALIHQYEHKYNALHTSTDGIVVKANQEFDLKPELGGLKIEFSGDALFFRNKFYIGYNSTKPKLNDPDEKPLESSIFPGKYIVKYALHGFHSTVHEIERKYLEKSTKYTYNHVNKVVESARSGWRVNEFIEKEGNININWDEFVKE
jgi:hypothetical protein